MSWTSPGGTQIDSPRSELSDKTRARARALAMAALNRQGWSLREIGRFFGVKHAMQVKRTLDAIPREAFGVPSKTA